MAKMDDGTNVTELSAYRRHRAYAGGWNRAHELSRRDRLQVELCGMEVLNPYASEPERSHWNEGFARADTP
jgi:hypothetical protein